MRIEQIAKLLFATTALWIFCVALIYAFVDVAGNGGRYWGFDGRTQPYVAAREAFEAGELRFLAYELETEFGHVERGAPDAYRCDFHEDRIDGHLRFNGIEARHGYDSARLADRFARDFNWALSAHIHDSTGTWCEPASLESTRY